MEYGYYSITQQLKDEAKKILDSLSPEDREIFKEISDKLWEYLLTEDKKENKK